MPIALGMSLCA